MLEKMQAVLRDQFIGFYLYGSLSLGDFDPASSDVDFLVVTTEDVSEDMFERLSTMHAIIASSGLPYANYIEGSYIPLKALRRYDPHNAHHATIGIDWPFRIAFHGSNWILNVTLSANMELSCMGRPTLRRGRLRREDLLDYAQPSSRSAIGLAERLRITYSVRGQRPLDFPASENEGLNGSKDPSQHPAQVCEVVQSAKHFPAPCASAGAFFFATALRSVCNVNR